MNNNIRHIICILLCSSINTIAADRAAPPPIWVEDTFEDFADGKLDASGQNIYVSHDGKIRTIHRFDVNNDGYLDLFFGNTHDIRFIVPPTIAFVTPQRKIEQKDLAALGSNHVRMADLNLDGYPDLVFSLNADGLQIPRKFVSIIYGGSDGWPARRCTGFLPALNPLDIAVVDLNADGWPDIAVLNSGSWIPQQPIEKNIRIYWGSKDAFLLTQYYDIAVPKAVCFASADFDKDGNKDLAVLSSDCKVRIFWATPAKDSQIKLKTSDVSLPKCEVLSLAAAPTLAHKGRGGDSDGHIDLVVGTDQDKLYLVRGQKNRRWGRPETISAFPASHISSGDLDNDGYTDLLLTYSSIGRAGGGEASAAEDISGFVRILWGDKKGFSSENSTKLQAKYAYATAVGDADSDGRMDIAVAVYQGEKTFACDSPIYFGIGNREFKLSDQNIRTEGATDVVIAPVQRDLPGRLVFSNSISGAVLERVPVYLYWGGPDGFNATRRLEIPCQSGHQATAADLNADGFTDLVVVYTVHGGKDALKYPFVGTNIFWGGADGFDLDKRRTTFREPYMDGTNVADLNRDGYLDLVLGGWDHWYDPGGEGPAELVIYYGSAEGLKKENRKALESKGRSEGVVIADFNKDDWLDIAVTSCGIDRVRIFWGGPQGFDVKRQQQLRASNPIGIETADLNADGYLDLIVGNYSDEVSGFFDAGNTIFWGSKDGFRSWDTQWLPGYCTLYQAVADFDNDGFLDIFCPNYHGQLNREKIPSYLYWGSADGFNGLRRTVIIGDSTADAQTGDFNRDGLIDLAISCHTLWGNHRTNSKVLYNDGNRFFNPKIQYLPTLGSHFMWMTDMGHIYDRKYRQRYESSIFQWNQPAEGGHLTYQAEMPEGTKLEFAVRSADTKDAIYAKPWRTVSSDNFSLETGDRCLQYQATFKSDNGDRYPVLDKVSISLGEGAR
jgi:hypothetical protein